MSDVNPAIVSDEFAHRIGMARGRRTRPIEIFDPAVLKLDNTAMRPLGQTNEAPFTQEASVIYNQQLTRSDIKTSMEQTNYADNGFSATDRTGS